MSDKALIREIAELTAQGSKPEDSASLIAMVLANPDNISAPIDNAAKIKTAWAKRAAIDAARQSLKPQLAETVAKIATRDFTRSRFLAEGSNTVPMGSLYGSTTLPSDGIPDYVPPPEPQK